MGWLSLCLQRWLPSVLLHLLRPGLELRAQKADSHWQPTGRASAFWDHRDPDLTPAQPRVQAEGGFPEEEVSQNGRNAVWDEGREKRNPGQQAGSWNPSTSAQP